MGRTASRRSHVIVAAASAALLLVGCGGGEAEPGAGGDAEETTEEMSEEMTHEEGTDSEMTDDADEGMAEATVVIADFSYQVPETVSAGAEITVTNEDDVGHTVTSDEEGIFDVVVGPGETVTFTAPEEAGEFPFHCTPHPDMTSTLVVE
ncbi:cupredoxin domain-containing protein [Georgenia alba]|uniref:Cupredoxin domain-containing protein n=1 Tax=Georgenia alba TaxID=2233858 RepID=A0ABW2QCF3_9MICO